MIVFDLTNKDSFIHVQDWIDEISTYTDPNIYKLVLGNKADINEDKVTNQDIEEFAKKTGIKVIEVSTNTSSSIENAIRITLENLIQGKYDVIT